MSLNSLKITLLAALFTCLTLVAGDPEIFAENSGRLIEYIHQNNCSCEPIETYSLKKEAFVFDRDTQEAAGFYTKQCLVISLDVFDAQRRQLSSLEGFIAFGLFWESLDPRNKWCGHSESNPHANHFMMNL